MYNAQHRTKSADNKNGMHPYSCNAHLSAQPKSSAHGKNNHHDQGESTEIKNLPFLS
ncbi:hypothetical protein PENANT_c005G06999 [Penicillium antarcticum]|uniref:Uncharacterized protein n=1 Tax=Penicillium antarcticum TaxID=416450 RepID=A0A1V6QED4_9EURO|nr:hypothetical protein PENANT_c005G06999 [Penicillium antarcticum]